MSYLYLATKKFHKRKNGKPNYAQSLHDFVLECYVNHPPASYGKYIQDKIILDCQSDVGYILEGVSDRLDCGDFSVVYPTDTNLITLNDLKKITCLDVVTISNKYSETSNFEIKVSFLGRSGSYSIRNIRPHQHINGGYLICLIDCENNFNIEFYLLDKSVILNHFKLSHMNGVSSQHENNEFENYGFRIDKDSNIHNIVREKNLLGGTTMEDLTSYIKSEHLIVKNNFLQNKEVKVKFGHKLDFFD